ncbi:MAG: hypothetical protein ABJN98_06250 [Roseibium sp.]
MAFRDMLVTAIMLAALFGMAVLLFNIPVGIDTKTFGAWVFGAILIFGIVNIILVVADGLKNKNNTK